MIQILPTENTVSRTFGWVQDPSSFRSLCDVVAIFDENSAIHRDLLERRIPALVEERDGREALMAALRERPLKIRYAHLVGTSFKPRSQSRCNGIVQAAVKGQKRPFIGDWPADNFVRWAQALGFIAYSYSGDTFQITESGLRLSRAGTEGKELNREEKEILTEAVLAYPPAVRILTLLSEDEDTHLTKYELGSRLGFAGEDGFTSLPQGLLIRTLAEMSDAAEKNKMKTDWDGSSDKYARMICRWLENLGLVKQIPKEVSVSLAGRTYKETIGQAYVITGSGFSALNRVRGRSRHGRIAKNLSYEMMSTKGKDREYLRQRRTRILKIISEASGPISYGRIAGLLTESGLKETVDTVRDDIRGLVRIGLDIKTEEEGCLYQDKIADFLLPTPAVVEKSDAAQLKEQLRSQISTLSHDYLCLLDLAYDGAQNRLFEMKTLELLTEECGFKGLHLGGSRKPDGIIYTEGLAENYGVIIDTKAYSKGYSLPIAQADEMERYVRENRQRREDLNPNQWWKAFEGRQDRYYFLFVSGCFKGRYREQIQRIGESAGVKGAALPVKELLLLAEELKAGRIDQQEFARWVFEP